jgi:hypothetical protein
MSGNHHYNSNNNNNNKTPHEFFESLRAIGDFLIENRAKTDYVLDCFFQQDVSFICFFCLYSQIHFQ